jgi:O-antigen ligase
MLVAFVACTAGFYREFAHLALPVGAGALYVTELVLVALLGIAFLPSLARGVLELRIAPGGALLLAFIAWGLICLYRGRADGLQSLRQCATNYYCMFALLVPYLLRDTKDFRRLGIAVCIGTAVAFAMAVQRLAYGEPSVTSTGALRYHSFIGVGASFVIFWLLGSATSSRREGVLKSCLVLGIAAATLLLTQQRSTAVALVAAGAAWSLWGWRTRADRSLGSPVLIISLMIALCLGIMLFGDLATMTFERLKTVLPSEGDHNTSWRLFLWALLLRGVLDSPIIGHGFGWNHPTFAFEGVVYGYEERVGVGVHNSYVFVLYKEGLIGLLLLTGFLILAGMIVRRVARSWSGAERALFGAFYAAFIFVAVFACFNVVLEGPYMGSLFWLYSAACMNMAVVLNRARSSSGRAS